MSGTALVTGGSRGIGRAVVEDLIAQGYEVINFSRTAPAKLLPGEIFESVDGRFCHATFWSVIS